jgi:hypothetical protein
MGTDTILENTLWNGERAEVTCVPGHGHPLNGSDRP